MNYQTVYCMVGPAKKTSVCGTHIFILFGLYSSGLAKYTSVGLIRDKGSGQTQLLIWVEWYIR